MKYFPVPKTSIRFHPSVASTMVPPPDHLPGPLPRHPRPRWTGPRWSQSSPPPWGSRTSPGLLLAGRWRGDFMWFRHEWPTFFRMIYQCTYWIGDVPLLVVNHQRAARHVFRRKFHPTWWFLSQLGSMIWSIIGHLIPLHTIISRYIPVMKGVQSTCQLISQPPIHLITPRHCGCQVEAIKRGLTYGADSLGKPTCWGKTSAFCKIGVPENWYAQNMASDGQRKWLLKWW